MHKWKWTLLSLWMCLPAFAEAPMGNWICTGQNPGDSRTYQGSVSVERREQTYTVAWRFGSKTYLGTGIELGDAFAVTFSDATSQFIGLVLMRRQGEQWTGNWTTLGGKQLGLEKWRKLSTD